MLVYNTQLHKKVELTPIEPGKIRMYVCGPTVYDQIHVGNGRTFLAFDIIRRYLSYKGYQVTFAQNLTDVDDKIINRANEQGRTPEEVASEFSVAFIEQMHRLGVLDPAAFVSQVYPFAQIGEAFQRVERGDTNLKFVIKF